MGESSQFSNSFKKALAAFAEDSSIVRPKKQEGNPDGATGSYKINKEKSKEKEKKLRKRRKLPKKRRRKRRKLPKKRRRKKRKLLKRKKRRKLPKRRKRIKQGKRHPAARRQNLPDHQITRR